MRSCCSCVSLPCRAGLRETEWSVRDDVSVLTRPCRSAPPPEMALWRRRSESAGGFLISKGALAFSCEAPGPPCRMLCGVLLDVDMLASVLTDPADSPGSSYSV